MTTPTIRVRINHTRTIKNGWQHETTVEIVEPQNSPMGDYADFLAGELVKVDTIARAESARRTALDQQEDTNAHD